MKHLDRVSSGTWSKTYFIPSRRVNCSRQKSVSHGLSDFFRNKILKIKTLISLMLQFRRASSIVQCISRRAGSSLNVLAPISVEKVVKLVTAMQSKSSPRDILLTLLLKSRIDGLAPAIAYMTNLKSVFPRRVLFRRF